VLLFAKELHFSVGSVEFMLHKNRCWKGISTLGYKIINQWNENQVCHLLSM